MSPIELVETVVAGIAVGFVSALFGVGGAVLMIPYIVLVLHGEQHLAEGTSLIAMVPIAISGIFAHAKRGYVLFGVARRMALGAVAGAILGGVLAQMINGEALQTIYAGFIAFVGVTLISGGVRDSRAANRKDR